MNKHGKHRKPLSPLAKGAMIAGCCLLAVALAVGAVFGLLAILLPTSSSPTSAPSSLVSTPPTQPSTTTTATTTTTTAAPTTTTTVYVFKTLTFSKPTQKAVTTSESTFAFMGSADPKSTLTMNGKKVALSAIGGFSVDTKLKPGVNTFTFKNNGKTVTYHITYKAEVLRSVSPNKAELLEGGSSIQFRAVARRGATVTVTLDGKKKTMKVLGEQEDAASDFTTYQATFTLPNGKVGVTSSLGAASITASLNGLKKTMKTGVITLKAKSGDKFVVVTRDYAETFSGEVVNDYSRPTAAYLPAGTIDQVVGSGSAAGNKYYRLGCGRWVYTSDVKLIDTVDKLTNTPLTGGTVTVTNQSTDLAFGAKWKIPYDLQLLPQTYTAPNATVPNYSIKKQTTEYIDIPFYYVSTVPAASDLSDSPLFSTATWRKENGNWILRLTLRHKGVFVGYSVQWEGNTLRFSFKHPHGTAGNPAEKPLTGLRIVLDPGHGGSSSGTYGTIKGLYEKTVALDYSLLLRDKLEALGATVVMTRTTDVLPDNPTMATRTAHARNNHTDLLLSIHMNGSSASSASGCTLHYFNEYSYDLARRLTDTMRTVEKQHGIGNRSQVTIWSPFFMARLHDCPAVLVECGFMTNAANMNKLVDTGYKDQLTDAIVKAVTDYFAALPAMVTPQQPENSTPESSLPDSVDSTLPPKEEDTP